MAVTVESLALEVASAFEPLKDRLAAGEVRTLFAELGMPTPDVVLAAPGVVSAIGDTATALGDLPDKIGDLVDAIEAEDPDTLAIVAALTALTPVIASVTTTVDRIADAVDAAASGAASAEIEAFAAALPGAAGRLPDRELPRAPAPGRRRHRRAARPDGASRGRGNGHHVGVRRAQASPRPAGRPARRPVPLPRGDLPLGRRPPVGAAAGAARPVRQQRRQGRVRAARGRRRPTGAADLHGGPRPDRRRHTRHPCLHPGRPRAEAGHRDPPPPGACAGRGPRR